MDHTNTAYISNPSFARPSNPTTYTLQQSQPNAFGYEIPQSTDTSASREYRPGLPNPTFFLAGEPFRQSTLPNSFMHPPQHRWSYDYGRSQANGLLGVTNYVRYPVPTYPIANFPAAMIPVPYNFYGPFCPQVPLNAYAARPCYFGYNPPWFRYVIPGNFAYSRQAAPPTFLYPRVPYGQQHPRYYHQPTSNLFNNYSQQPTVGNVGPDYAAQVQNNPGRVTLVDVVPCRRQPIRIEPDVKNSDDSALLESIKKTAATPVPVLAAITVEEENGVFSERNRPESPATIPEVSIEWAEQQLDVSLYRAVPTLEESKPNVVVPEETIELKEISPCNEIANDITLTELSPVTDKPLVSPTIRRYVATSETPKAPAIIFNLDEFPPLSSLSALTKVNKDKRYLASKENKENIAPDGKCKTPQAQLKVTPKNTVREGSSKISSKDDEAIKKLNTKCPKKFKEKPCKPGAILINSVHPFFKIKHVLNMVKCHGHVYKIARCFDEDKRFVKYKVFFDNEEEARIAMVTLHGDNLRGYTMKIDFIVANSRDALEKEVKRNWKFPEISCKLFK